MVAVASTLSREVVDAEGAAVSGRGMSLRFYEREVRPRIAPVLDDLPHAAAQIGDGSDVLGFDDRVSPDHDFGPRVQIVLPEDIGSRARSSGAADLARR